jgi:hypothetical protein
MPFIPDLDMTESNIPYFEDDQDQKLIPGRGTHKNPKDLQREVADQLAKLGASGVYFAAGKYPGEPTRYGVQILFSYGRARGRLDCAALPLRSETPIKKDRALAQALYLLRNKLESMVYAYIYEPGSVPLLPYLIGQGGLTVTEHLVKTGDFTPLLASGNN